MNISRTRRQAAAFLALSIAFAAITAATGNLTQHRQSAKANCHAHKNCPPPATTTTVVRPTTTTLVNPTTTLVPTSVSTSTTSASTSTTSVPKTTTTVPSTHRTIWSAGMEAGNLNEWSLNGGGGIYNSGSFTASASTAQHRSGSWSLSGTIDTSAGSSGVRAFRWDEARSNRDAYYSVWLYVPTGARVAASYWNVFQFKSRTTDASPRVDPLWGFYAVSDATGLYLHAGWGMGHTPLAGPHAGDDISQKWYEQTGARVYLPQGRWTHLEAFLHESTGTDFSGRLTFWQDGQQLFDLANVRTTYNNCNYNAWCADDEWSVNVYSDGMSPNPFTAYFDDASIAVP